MTHPEASRYFMTIPEACSLVLKTGGVGRAGQTYLLDMGEPVRIRDLAEQMIRFYGFEPGRDIKIEYIGLRRGERVEERLYAPDEVLVPTGAPAHQQARAEGERSSVDLGGDGRARALLRPYGGAREGISQSQRAPRGLEKIGPYAYRSRE